MGGEEITSFVAAALLSCTNASAQSPWEGGIKADGAWNFRQSNNENLDFRLKYNKEETWNADMNYLKVSTTAPMHRAARIGISYTF